MTRISVTPTVTAPPQWTHQCHCVVPIESEVQQADEGEQIADMERASGRVNAEVDCHRLLDVLPRGPAAQESLSAQSPRYKPDHKAPGEFREHPSLFEFTDDIPTGASRRKSPRSLPRRKIRSVRAQQGAQERCPAVQHGGRVDGQKPKVGALLPLLLHDKMRPFLGFVDRVSRSYLCYTVGRVHSFRLVVLAVSGVRSTPPPLFGAFVRRNCLTRSFTALRR